MNSPSGRRKAGPALARIGLILAVLAPIVLLIGALGSKFGLLHYQVGLLGLLAALVLLIVGGVLGLIALILVLRSPGRQGLGSALVAVAGGLVVVVVVMQIVGSLPKNPGIHDVATDWTQPIMFSADTMAARGAGSNPVDSHPVTSKSPALGALAGKSIAEINAATCDAAKPAILAAAPAEAYARVKAAVQKNKLTILHDDPAAGVLEAVDSTFWFGFKDDVAFRIRPEGAGSRVDLRSISRVGGGDLGANCKRIARLKASLAG